MDIEGWTTCLRFAPQLSSLAGRYFSLFLARIKNGLEYGAWEANFAKKSETLMTLISKTLISNEYYSVNGPTYFPSISLISLME